MAEQLLTLVVFLDADNRPVDWEVHDEDEELVEVEKVLGLQALEVIL